MEAMILHFPPALMLKLQGLNKIKMQILNHLSLNLIVICFILLSGVGNSVVDLIENKPKFNTSVFSNYEGEFWGAKEDTWRNKYKLDSSGKAILDQPRFFLSTTVLVLLTDAWHFFKSLFLTLLIIGVVLYKYEKWWLSILMFLILKLSFSIGWHIGTFLFT
jgi:hypothetical protein